MSEPEETAKAEKRKRKRTRKSAPKPKDGNGADEQSEQPEPEPAPESIKHKGQTLVKVERKPEPEPEPKAEQLQSVNDVVQKHAERLEQEGPNEPPHDEDGVVLDDEPEPPPIEEVAQPTTLHGHGPVPPSESDPTKRDAPTMGQVEFTEDAVPDLTAPKRRPRSLEELMAIFPIGNDPQYYIQVTRRAPAKWFGVPVAGVQRPIRELMTLEDFKGFYGGGEYTLTVFGPPKRGGQLDEATGRARPKPLTEEVRFVVPYGRGYGLEPNPYSAFEEGEEEEGFEEDEMAMHRAGTGGWRGPGLPRVTNPADANIHKADLEHHRWERGEDARQELERERLRHESEEGRRRQEQSTIETVQTQSAQMLDLIASHSKDREEAERRERGIEAQRRRDAEDELRQIQNEERKRALERPSAASELAAATSTMTKPLVDALQGRGDDGEVKALRMEVTRLQESHKNELIRIQEAKESDIRRERESREEAIKREHERAVEAQQNAEKLVRDGEERARVRVREVEDRAERDVKRAVEDGDRRVNDLRQSYELRIKDEEKSHGREVRSLQSNFDTRAATEKSMAENRATTLQGEVERERADKERFRKEAVEKGDIVKQVGKITEAAEVLGMRPAGEAEQAQDWKQIVANVGLTLAQNLPETLKNAGDAVAGAKGGGPQVQVVQQPGMLPPGATPPGLPSMQFATEGEEEFVGEDLAPVPQYPAPAAPMAPMAPLPPQPVAPSPPAPQSVAQQMAPMAAPPAPVVVPTMPHAAPAAPPRAPGAPTQPPTMPRALRPAQPVAPASAPVAAIEVPTEMILSFREPFEEAFRVGMPVTEFAAQLQASHGTEMVATVAASLTPRMVTEALLTTQDGARSPLVRREGQRYLGELLAAIKAAGG